MIAALPRIAGRALALAILVGLAGVLYAGLVVPVLDDYAATRQRLAQSTALAERYRRIADELPHRRAALVELRQQPVAQAGFLAGTNEILAGAELQSRIKSLVEAEHGELKSTQILPVQQDGDFRRVGVRGEMSIPLPAAQRVLYAIETTTPWLILDNVVVSAREVERRQERNPELIALELTFDAYGYLRRKP